MSSLTSSFWHRTIGTYCSKPEPIDRVHIRSDHARAEVTGCGGRWRRLTAPPRWLSFRRMSLRGPSPKRCGRCRSHDVRENRGATPHADGRVPRQGRQGLDASRFAAAHSSEFVFAAHRFELTQAQVQVGQTVIGARGAAVRAACTSSAIAVSSPALVHRSGNLFVLWRRLDAPWTRPPAAKYVEYEASRRTGPATPSHSPDHQRSFGTPH
jgi:hypothetical protein